MTSNCNWDAIHGFRSPGEYQRFCNWLESQIEAGMVEFLPAGTSCVDIGFGFEEKWFKCRESGQIWRLVSPQVPFRGSWSQV
jgi:hypothetical protein